jgi:PAS domain S-box-containing protein
MKIATNVIDDDGRSGILREIDQTAADAYAAATFGGALHVLAQHARLMIGAHQSVLSYVPDGDVRAAIHTYSFSKKYQKYKTYDVMPTGEGIWEVFVEKKLPMRMTQEQILSHPRWKNFTGLEDARGLEHPPMRGWLAVPILRQNGEFVGVLQLTDKYRGQFTEQNQAMLTRLANVISPTFDLQYVKRELERLTEELRANEAKYRALYDNAPDMYVAVEPATARILDCNQTLIVATGCTKEETIGRPVFDLYHPDCMEHAKKVFQSFVQTGEVHDAELQLIRRDGSKIEVSLNASSFRDEHGNILYNISAWRDITERKRMEEQLRKHRDQLEELVKERTVELERSNIELNQFAYVASHDLQEPLRMVASYVQLLARRYQGKLDADADEFIAFAADGATRMQTLIRDLLVYSHVGTESKSFEPTECETILDNALDNLRAPIQENGAVVTRAPVPIVMGNTSQLTAVFQNLIGNAIKFRNDKSPEVHVKAERKDSEWLFSVRDKGIGIDLKHAERIFVIFQRLHSRAEYSGTGIGLAICKKIVERHNGRIWVESLPGKGSTFYFTIPMKGEE